MKKIIASTLLFLATITANAEPLKIVLSYPPGGAADIVARVIEKEMINRGREAVVIYKATGEGIVAINEVLTAKPDGNTILISGSGPIIFKSVENEKNYNNMSKLVPVIHLTNMPNAIVANSQSNIKTLKQLIQTSKTRYVNIGVSSAAGRGIAKQTFPKDAKVTIVPFNGDVPALTNVLNGSLDATINTYGSVAGAIAAGKVTGLAVTTPTSVVGGDGNKIPSIKEQGINFSTTIMYGVFLPPGVSEDTRNKLFYTISTIINTPENKEILKSRMMLAPENQTTDSFSQFVTLEVKKWNKILNVESN